MTPNLWLPLIWIGISVLLLGLLSYMIGRYYDDQEDDGAVLPILILAAIIWPIALALFLLMFPFLWLADQGTKRRAHESSISNPDP